MITDIQCRIYATECERLGIARDISTQRATVLMAMANSWHRLADDTVRYDAIVAKESAPADGPASPRSTAVKSRDQMLRPV